MQDSGYFITGTDTEIGKTFTSVCLINYLVSKKLRVAGLKPVASGCETTDQGLRNEDARQLMEAANVELEYDQVNRYSFEPAIAPHIAAHLSGQVIELGKIENDFHAARSVADRVIVEAAGGWRVPLNDEHNMADLAIRLGLPVIAVVGIRLGCINHALMTLEQIQSSAAVCAGWVANYVDNETAYAEEQCLSIQSRTEVPCVAEINYGASFSDIQWRLDC